MGSHAESLAVACLSRVVAVSEHHRYHLRTPTVSQQLRKVIESDPRSRNLISKTAGVPASAISRFVASGRGLRSESPDKHCTAFGLVLVKKGKRA